MERRVRQLKRIGGRLGYSSLLCSSLATMVCVLALALAPSMGNGPTAWPVICGVVAGLGASAALLSGLQQGTGMVDRLANALACTIQLRGLEVALTVAERSAVQVAKDYEELMAQYQELLS
jgi:hypothetical protein